MREGERTSAPGRGIDLPLALGAALSVLLLLSATVAPYEWFIDELYYLACARRLALGYVDQPPLSILLLAGERALLGGGQVAARVLPAIAAGAAVWLAGRTTRFLGGGRAAEALAALGTGTMPVLLVFGSFYSMNAYEPLLVLALFLLALRMVRDADPRGWLAIGVVTGIGLELKHTFALHAAALVAGILATGARRLLRSPWALLGALACLALVAPNLLWQQANGWPSLELYRNSFGSKNIDRTAWQVLGDQVLFVGPASLPLWLGGLLALATPRLRPYRFVAVAYAVLLAAQVVAGSSRPDRITSIYPVLMAFGAAALARGAERWRRGAEVAYAGLLLGVGLTLAPIFVPVLPPARLGPYVAALGLHLDVEAGKRGEPVPQWLADRIGWRSLALEVARVARSLPEDERRDAVVVSTSYGTAGALELHGAELGLPPVHATHNAFHAWGPPPASTRTFIGVQVDGDAVRRQFRSVEEVAVFRCPDCTRPQRRIPVYVLRDPVVDLVREWPRFRNHH